MMGRRSASAGLVMMMGLIVAGTAEAHRKDYLVSQDYYTATRGEVEVALWNQMNFAEADNDDTYNSTSQLEVEYGVLDHLQLAYYEVYTWDRAQDWERDELKIEAKARVAQAGQLPVDVAFYTEYANPNGRRESASDELENKIIVSKDFGPINLIGNFIFGRKINRHDNWDFEYTAGASYGVTPRVRLGLEVKESLGDSGEFGIRRKDHELLLVPGIYATPARHVRVLFGPAFGLTRASDDLRVQSIVEVEF